MANKSIRIDQLGSEISAMLEGYSLEAKDRVDQAGEKAIKKMVKLSKASAPEDTGQFKKNITWSAKVNALGAKKFIWHVKAPFHRLTHLIVHGHATVNGGRVPGDKFLHEAVDAVLPEYLEDIEEALIE